MYIRAINKKKKNMAGAVSDKYGVKVTSMAGTVALVGGLLLGSAANQLWLLYTTQGFMIGIAGAFLYFPGVSVVSQWFTTKRARATSLAASKSD